MLRNLHISASIWSVQLSGILGGFLELESRSFWLDTIPFSKEKVASRAKPAQCPRSIRWDIRRSVRRIVRVKSGNLSGHQPGSIRLTSEPMPSNVRHDVRSRVQSMTSPQSVHDRDHRQSLSAQCPRSIRRGVQRIIRAHPVNYSEIAGQLPRRVRAVSGKCLIQRR